MALPAGTIRLLEVLGSISLATDLGTGQPLGHGIRTCLLATEIAGEMGVSPERLRMVQQVGLLRFLGCTADASETARAVGGDEIGFNRVMAPTLGGSALEAIKGMTAAVGAGKPAGRRGLLLAGMLTRPGEAARGLAAHCEVAAMLARRLGLDPAVITALEHAYERWDGKGYPQGLRAEAIPFEIRVCSVARDVDLCLRRRDDPLQLLEARRGTAYDPAVVDACRRLPLHEAEANWERLLGAEPEPVGLVGDLDRSLAVLADFVDLKSPWTRGHSHRVADLAVAGAAEAGIGTEARDRLRRAALVHDLGRVGVENGVWDKPGPLAIDDWEKVRLHPYLTQRVLARCPALAPLADLAAGHHERLDGSGYHHGLAGSQLGTETRVLAAADALAGLTSSRPHRTAHPPDVAFRILEEEGREGRLDRRAVAAVLVAVGSPAPPPPWDNPGGLTDREVEVLRHIAQGSTNRQVGEALFISVKTVGRHVENIYAKIGVSTRAGAALYAMESHLLE